jgi:hypothetical protein
MAGSCWRLLAALSLMLVAPAFLRGQDPFEERIPFSPNFPPSVRILRYPPPVDAMRLPLSPNLPQQSQVAQSQVAPDTAAFEKIVGAAGIIFSGHVTSVGHVPLPSGQAPASTAITFQVDRGIRGISAGQILTIHEWAGLWAGGERYRVGERVLLFLYPPSKLGLSSPVDGTMGRLTMDSQGRILMNGQHIAAWGGDPILGGRTAIPYADFARAVRRFRRAE